MQLDLKRFSDAADAHQSRAFLRYVGLGILHGGPRARAGLTEAELDLVSGLVARGIRQGSFTLPETRKLADLPLRGYEFVLAKEKRHERDEIKLMEERRARRQQQEAA